MSNFRNLYFQWVMRVNPKLAVLPSFTFAPNLHGLEQFFNVISRTDFVVQLIKLVESKISWFNHIILKKNKNRVDQFKILKRG